MLSWCSGWRKTNYLLDEVRHELSLPLSLTMKLKEGVRGVVANVPQEPHQRWWWIWSPGPFRCSGHKPRTSSLNIVVSGIVTDGANISFCCHFSAFETESEIYNMYCTLRMLYWYCRPYSDNDNPRERLSRRGEARAKQHKHSLSHMVSSGASQHSRTAGPSKGFIRECVLHPARPALPSLPAENIRVSSNRVKWTGLSTCGKLHKNRSLSLGQ